ncbi:MMPL family transporter [Zhihengliuella halotolerans]|uniref:MMPL family transporter n=1 Tax=Zhihengliuella halotolerans TaxID=370736 RepID=UPI000C80719E|nr:MMPL family transporter [Zhihengliuella halotolerans]
MASFLYRLGRAAFRRRWWFIAAWAAVLTIVALCAGLFMGTLTNQFSIPGTETQQTLDRLKEELPEAAGGTGTIVFQTEDGQPFTEAQRSAVAAALGELEQLDPVREARDPFETQQQLDDALADLDEGRTQLEEGRAELEDGKQQLADGKQQLEDGRTEVADGWKQLEAGQSELDDGRAELEASRPELEQARAQLADGRAEYEAGQAKLADGRAEYQAGKQQLEKGRADYQNGLAEYRTGVQQAEAGAQQIAAAERDLADGQSELDAGREQYETGVARLTSQFGVSTLADTTKAFDAGQAQLDAAAESGEMSDAEVAAAQAQIDEGRAAVEQLTATGAQLDAGQAELDSGRAALEAKQKELTAGEKELAGAKRQLDAAKAEIADGQKELDAASAQLTAGQAELDAAAAQLADGETKLAAGERQFAEGQAQIEAGEAEIAANEERLTEAEATLDAEAAKIPEAEAELADGEAELADAEAQISLGTRQAASSEGLRFVSADGTTAAAAIQFVGSTDALTPAEREEIQRVADSVGTAGVDVEYSKEIIQDISEVFGAAEIIGIAIAAIVLFVMLGTIVAAGLPLIVAVLGVAVGVGSTLALSSVIEMASITPALALMLGLAVGIDYSLFIVHRHRRQLLDGMEMEESIGRATGTSGNAVVFAGLTVVIALAALVVPRLPFLSILGLSAALTVAVAVVMALTLTPAILGALGQRLLSKKARARAAAARESAAAPHPGASAGGDEQGTTTKRGWGALATRRPWLTTIVSVAVLGLIALPALELRTALPDGSAEPVGSSARTAHDEVAERFGAGYNGPLLAVVDLPRTDDGAALDEDGALEANLDVADYLRDIDGVVAAVPVSTNEANTVGIVQIIPAAGPSDEQTEELVHELRAEKGAIAEATGSEVALTGQVVGQIDVSEKLAEALPLYLGIVVGLSLILLLLVFRSVVVPLLATAGFLLSLFAAFGATVAVYQWGWLGEIFGVASPGPIMSFLPILLTGILFGLAMDYQVFLVSGMREAFAHGQDAREAVTSGFRHAAPVVTAAALIMASVFAGFIFSHMTMIRAIGFSLAFGVLFDAFVVRMTLTPAVMHLLGRHAWYLPRWLEKVLPDVDVEGAKLQAPRDKDPDADDALGLDDAFGPDGEFYANSPTSPATSELPATGTRV